MRVAWNITPLMPNVQSASPHATAALGAFVRFAISNALTRIIGSRFPPLLSPPRQEPMDRPMQGVDT